MNKYTKNLNISFLTYNAKAVKSFIQLAFDRLHPGQTSNVVKTTVYEDAFGIERREKYTGFEKLTLLDSQTRRRCKQYLKEKNIIETTDEYNQNTPVAEKDITHRDDTDLKNQIASYIDTLVETAKVYDDPDNLNLVYYSGGADSEVVILSFLKANVDFIPVIFKFVDSDGIVYNDHDLAWAYKFLDQHNLPYAQREINVVDFWNSDLILEYAVDWSNSSPQLLTHYRMIDLLHREIENTGDKAFMESLIKCQ